MFSYQDMDTCRFLDLFTDLFKLWFKDNKKIGLRCLSYAYI